MVTQRRRAVQAAAAPAGAEGFGALADPTRQSIVRLLIEGERSVGEIAERLPVSRPAVSKHLRLLQDCGLVRSRTEGTRNVFSVRPDSLAALRDELDRMWQRALARYALLANNTKVRR
jgi:DNA-binding transcriptional ArsR family regulator